MYDKKFMKKSYDIAYMNSCRDVGGPFGACVVKDGEIISCCSNTVLLNKDSTCHAEMNAIREACSKLKTYDLSDCELYCTGYPCPMCFGAIMWAGIKKVYVSGKLEDAEKIGFSDKFIYETIDNISKMCYNRDVIDIQFFDNEFALDLYDNYSKNNKTMY